MSLIALCFWLAYEWGPGNETVTPWLLSRLLSDNGGVTAIVLLGVVGFSLTTLQQLASGLTALVAFSLFNGTAKRSWDAVRSRDTQSLNWDTASWSVRVALVFGLGTTAVALTQIVTTGETGVRRHLRAVVSAALLCGCVVGSLGATGAVLVVAARRVPSLRGRVDFAVDVLGNPFVWMAVATFVLVRPMLHRPAE